MRLRSMPMPLWLSQVLRPVPSPALRLAIGLAMMAACLFVGLDLATGLVVDPGKAAATTRLAVAESIALRLSRQMDEAAPGDLSRWLRQTSHQHPDILAMAVRSNHGEIVAAAGEFDALPAITAGQRSTLNHLLVPLNREHAPWGRLDLVFKPVYPETLSDRLVQPYALTLAGLCLLGSVAFYLYLRRALQYLDPTSAVPDRVRAAFDTLAEGVVVLDRSGRIVLANQRFRDLVPNGSPEIYGRAAGDLPWLTASLMPDGNQGDNQRNELPWIEAMRRQVSVENIRCTLTQADSGVRRHYVLRANPIADAGARRGCILTFDDISDLHRSNQQLTRALQRVESSQAQIQEQNRSLQRLASRDPLTDCLNRRAFFESLQRVAAGDTAKRSFGVAMCDIDFFKRVNDEHGHGAGDTVLKAVAAVLQGMVRDHDLLCRMGGEEFCIVWFDLSAERTTERAEQLRLSLERAAPVVVESGEVVRPTISVGVAHHGDTKTPIDVLIDQADKALYEAKRSGRNRVVAWPFDVVAAPPEPQVLP